MSLISFFRHAAFYLHENPPMHPEKPDRLGAIDRAINGSNLSETLLYLEPRLVKDEELCHIHSPSYVEHLENVSKIAQKQNKLIQLDEDTFISSGTLKAAKLAAGAGLTAVESLLQDQIIGSFVAVRPPGHHAFAERQMGFCVFNNIALAASYAKLYLGCKKILIIDWDVHHGNGTQDIFYNDPSVLFISLHQYPYWPYKTGWYTEDGTKDGKGYNLNIPLPDGTGDSGYLSAWDQIVLPVSLEYKPDIILVSAGYDAHKDDYIGGQHISTTGFALLASRLRTLAHLTQTKTICFLEGGYNVEALSQSVVATLQELSEKKEDLQLQPETGNQSPQEVKERLSLVAGQFKQYWSSLR